MALVSANAEILEEAHDYAVNYTYALEEGLDPMVLVGEPSEKTRPEPVEQVSHSAAAQEGLPSFLRRTADENGEVRFSSIRKVGLAAITG